MSTITDARALLQRVREEATPGPWYLGDFTAWKVDGHEVPTQTVLISADWDFDVPPVDASLIVLLAGNPALLDAIDGMLADAAHIEEHFTDDVEAGFRHYAERIASALVQQGTAMGIAQPAPEGTNE